MNTPYIFDKKPMAKNSQKHKSFSQSQVQRSLPKNEPKQQVQPRQKMDVNDPNFDRTYEASRWDNPQKDPRRQPGYVAFPFL